MNNISPEGMPASFSMPPQVNELVPQPLRTQPEQQQQTRPVPFADTQGFEWELAAACRGLGVEQFFAPDMEGRGSRKGVTARREAAAKTICSRCPVIEQCLSHALRTREPYGVWGGKTEDERAAMLGLTVTGRTRRPSKRTT